MRVQEIEDVKHTTVAIRAIILGVVALSSQRIAFDAYWPKESPSMANFLCKIDLRN